VLPVVEQARFQLQRLDICDIYVENALRKHFGVLVYIEQFWCTPCNLVFFTRTRCIFA